MEQQELQTKKSDKGFTLIELLIVIVILGILATVVVFAVGGIRGSADTSVCETRKSEVATAAEAYFATEGAQATTVGELATANLLTSPTFKVNATLTTGATTTIADVAAATC